MGSVQFTHLNDLSREIWLWCEQRDIFPYASYISSSDNEEADSEARNLEKET